MSLEMAQSILEPFLLKKDGLLDVRFIGGETLLAIDVIRPLIEWAENGRWNRKYSFFGSTNGTLLDAEVKHWLKQHSNTLTLGLSYDGLPSVQSTNRGVSDIDIDFFLDTWSGQPIQMTVNAESVYNMADGIIFLLRKGALVHPNVAFENTEWEKSAILEYERQLMKLTAFYADNRGYPLVLPLEHDLNEYADNIKHPKHQHEVCGAGNGSQVFDVDGVSYPCHILSPLVLDDSKVQQVRNGLIDDNANFEDLDCIGCPFNTSCPTCMACNFLYRGSLNKRDRTHCEIMKAEVRAVIRGEVMRLKRKTDLSPEDASEIDSIAQLVRYLDM